jgi:putative addiction module killer protein
MQYEIEFYVQKNGRIPLETWLQGLDQKTHNRIMARLDRVQLGNFGDHKTVGGGVSELRFFFGSGYRVYYGIDQGKLVLLLIGGDKKSQNKDITRAQEFWNLYLKET